MKIVIGPVRLSYAHIFETHADLNDNQKYSASFIIPKKSRMPSRQCWRIRKS